jgi:hypothetical protein
MRPRATPTRTHAALMCAFAILTVLTCAGLLTAAALVPAPPVVLPIIVLVCIAGPMVAAWELRGAVAVLRREGGEIAAMRRQLQSLPETQHPLGL